MPILWKDEEKVDNMFHTCCVLHNMLLSWSGLSENMINDAIAGQTLGESIISNANAGRTWCNIKYDRALLGVRETWHDWNDCGHMKMIGNRRVFITSSYDASGLGVRAMRDMILVVEVDAGEDGWLALRTKLIAHFTYRYKNRRAQITWPSSKAIV